MKARCDSRGGVPVVYWGPVYLWLMLPKLCPFPYNVPKAACMAFWLPPWFLSAPRPSLCFQLFASFVPIGDCFLCDLEKGLPVAHRFYQSVFPFTVGTPLTCTAFTTAFRIWAHTWRSEDDLQMLGHSFSQVHPRDQSHVIRPGNKCLYHLESLVFFFNF